MSPEAGTKSKGAAALVALGIVYGDIGTSPLYALKAALAPLGGSVTPEEVLGILSLVFWAMTLVVSLKYVTLMLRADNGGEGGILALSSLLTDWAKENPRRTAIVTFLSVTGCSLLLGDGMLTPAISVLSAVEGLSLITPALSGAVIPVTLGILAILFGIQRRGTRNIARIFGPVMLTWFLCIGGVGLVNSLANPWVFQALLPHHAINFAFHHGGVAAVVFGAVFLVLTGGEALYADIGHCGGRIPLRNAWFTLVMPSLMLCYLGQGAVVIADPAALANPFYSTVPPYLLFPLVLLATAATIIASQALISGVFTMTRQAMQLGFCPRVRVRQTHGGEIGQIYVPVANWVLAAGCFAFVLGFGSSEAMAHAYGIAVSFTMLATTLLFCIYLRHVMHRPMWMVILFGAFFILLDLGFALANLAKIAEGGWVPLVIAGFVAWLSSAWRCGSSAVRKALEARAVNSDDMRDFFVSGLVRTPGTEVFLTKTSKGLPPILCEYARKTRSLAEAVVVLHFETARVPYLRRRGNVHIEDLGMNVWRVSASYGYMQVPRVDAALEEARILGLPVRTSDALVVVGMETAYRTGHTESADDQRKKADSSTCLGPISFAAYRTMSRLSPSATTNFKLPYDRVLEIGLYVRV